MTLITLSKMHSHYSAIFITPSNKPQLLSNGISSEFHNLTLRRNKNIAIKTVYFTRLWLYRKKISNPYIFDFILCGHIGPYPRPYIPDLGTMNANTLVDDLMNIITMYFVFSEIYMGVENIFFKYLIYDSGDLIFNLCKCLMHYLDK